MRGVLAVCLMFKDEVEQVKRTIDSIINSTTHFEFLCANTDPEYNAEWVLEYIREKKFSLRTTARLRYHHEFPDFSTVRNILLDNVNDYITNEYKKAAPIKFILTLDANDEVKNPIKLVKWLDKCDDGKALYSMNIYWEDKVANGEDLNSFYHRCLLIRASRLAEVRYIYRVHEILTVPRLHGIPEEERAFISLELTGLPDVFVYQNRSKDKSSKWRVWRDIDWLTADYHDNPRDLRVISYLARYYLGNKYPRAAKFFAHMLIDCAKTAKNTMGVCRGYYYLALARMDYQIPGEQTVMGAAKECLKYDPWDGRCLFLIADLYSQMGRPREAKVYIDKCCEIDCNKLNRDQMAECGVYIDDRWKLKKEIYEKLKDFL